MSPLGARRARTAVGLALGAALAACAPGPDAGSIAQGTLEPEVRPDTPGNNLQFRFDPGDVVEAFGSTDGNFLVHFTRLGPNAVPDTDADTSGVPDFVEDVASVYVEVLASYAGDLGFQAPLSDAAVGDNGGDGRFDVYLVDFAGVGDGNFQHDACGPQNPEQCNGYMIEENDFAGYGYPSTAVANRILGSHEFFHAVQAAYDVGQGSVLAEGTAVWATEAFDPTLDDFEWLVSGYLDNPDQPLDTPLPGPVDAFSYGTGLYFEFLEERYGAGMVRALWERAVNGAFGVADPVWMQELPAMLTAEAGVSFADSFVEFATWNLYTGGFADPAVAYLRGAGYPRVRMSIVAAPFQDDALRVFHASSQYYALAPDGRTEMTAALVAPATDPSAADGLALLVDVEGVTDVTSVTRLVDPGAGTETVSTAGAARVVVVVVNPLTSGSSKKPALCIGTVAEVAACRDALGAGGAGGGPAAPAEAAPEETSGCACRQAGTAGARTDGVAAALAMGGLAVGAARRRRRRG
ncbi:MAG: hypothetical protein IT373_11075 [Polyangiaceae bacterium]|nr:hypothetical protein [Polyangiaceae bacterium]